MGLRTSTMFWAVAIVAGIGSVLALAAGQRWRSASSQVRARLKTDSSVVRGEFSHAELAGLPPPVARFFGRVLHEGQPVIRAVELTQDGSFFVPVGGGKWCPMHAEQQFVVRPAGFVWDASIRMMPVVPVLVRDSYVEGTGTMHASFGGMYTITRQSATPKLDAGALQRYLAESVWFPTALLPSAGVEWHALNNDSAVATLTDGHTTVSMTFFFDATGDVERMVGDRYREDKGAYTLTPWIVTCGGYDTHNGVRIPTDCEVAWQLPAGLQPYWRGHISNVRYEFSH